ncbi:HAD family phosphatase [Phycicoccus sp. HDW14]|uniref:HAD family hydrolase n=1 Tax=Phycicoccus sp. HDW14 TaxID=2714941 RepID=UPI001F0D9104|nr:HAD-IB family hydrolase [Phycicoccus sp. HDW14]
MSGAAIFDLDRTLLQGGTGPLLSRAMYDLGVVSRKLPGEGLLYKAFDVLGETLPSIALARQATLVAKGRAGDTFDAAASAAAETIASVIHPFALTLIEQHKEAGRPVVLATTTPEHLVRPLAERLGVDHVVATRYALTDEGTFSGALDGRFVWSRGKLAAVREWAEREGIDLAESFAYSDSIYDLPLLSAVGSPAAVNPDPRLTVYALARGGPSCTSTSRREWSRSRSSGSSSSGCSSSPTRRSSRPTRASTSRGPRTSRAPVRPSSSATTAATSTSRR